MKAYTIGFFLLLFIAAPFVVHAGPESPAHKHNTLITNDQAATEAAVVIRKLVERGKLAKSWAEVQPSPAEQKVFKKGLEWVVSFTNPAEPSKEKQTLYVFISLTGKILAANFSGE